MSWLDVMIEFNPETYKMVFSPYMKPTALSILLSEDSHHHPNVHNKLISAVVEVNPTDAKAIDKERAHIDISRSDAIG